MFLVSFEDTATTDLSTYGLTLSLHDALPILLVGGIGVMGDGDYGSDPNILDTDSDAEEYIALAGTRGFEEPAGITADRITIDGTSLRFSDAAYGGSTTGSEERRGGRGCVRTCRSRWAAYH